jgi:hypothetical protein
MTFMGRDQRQYVVIAAGGGSFLAFPPGTKVVAFALEPQNDTENIDEGATEEHRKTQTRRSLD